MGMHGDVIRIWWQGSEDYQEVEMDHFDGIFRVRRTFAKKGDSQVALEIEVEKPSVHHSVFSGSK